MKLRTKLLLGQLPLLLALAVLAVVALVTLSQLGEHSQVILKDNYRSVLATQRMKESLERIDSGALFVLTGERARAVALIDEHRPRFERELRVQESNITEPGERELTRALRDRWDDYQKAVVRLLRASSAEQGRRLYFDELNGKFSRIKHVADEILGINQDAMVRKSDLAQRLGEQLSGVLSLAAVAALVLGAFASWAVVARLLRPVSALHAVVKRVGEGDLEAQAPVEGGDEIAALAQDFNKMAGRLAFYRKSSLGELLTAQRASQAAIDSLPDPVIIFDVHGAVANSNIAAERLLAADLDAASGTDPLSRLEPELRAVLDRVRAHVLSGKGSYVPRGYDEAVGIGSDDGTHFLLPRATPVYAEEGDVTGVTVVLVDVTRLRRFDELKNDMVATVAHEFRTPLTSLRMAIHLCTEQTAGPLTDAQADLLFAAREDCERLQTIVDDLLDLARIQAGRLARQRVDPGSLVRAAASTHRAAAADRSLELITEIEEPRGEIFVDPDRLSLVFTNLIGNAIRHTPPGGRIRVSAHSDGADAVRFEVSDTGEGIPAELRDRVFDKFFRVPGRPSGSAGLGLSICREIVEAHGGSIELRDTRGNGTTFCFVIPFAA